MKIILKTKHYKQNPHIHFACLCVFSAFGKTEIQPHHPRLLFTTTEEKAVKKLIKKDPLARQLAAFLKTKRTP